MLEEDALDLGDRLSAVFSAQDVKFKPQAVQGNRALAVAFIDARAVMDRLDQELGVMNWSDQYEILPGGLVKCTLSIRFQGEWVSREDVGGPSEQPDEGDRLKAAVSDALKRAAVKFGIGRFLYAAKPQWVDYDPAKRRFTGTPVLPAGPRPRKRHAEAAPVRQQATQQVQSNSRSSEETVIEAPKKPDLPFHTALAAYDAKLAHQGLCKAGQLVSHVARAAKEAGIGNADMTTWGKTEIALARGATRQFEVQRREEKERDASGRISLYETIKMTEEDMVAAGLIQPGELVDHLVRTLGRSIEGHVSKWGEEHREKVDRVISQYSEALAVPDVGD